ncbi:PCI domain-containing protein [Ditylenchus destructor]|nr:PCI domain-containing protein [Ditylenchus destructor]
MDNNAVVIRYKVIYARFLDRRGKFVEAAQRYYELSHRSLLSADERKQMLRDALTCTLLAPPSTQKNRPLGALHKDERCENMAGYSVLKEMYLERLIKGDQLVEFERTLHDHQQKIGEDGYSLLQRSIIEHNMLAISKLYDNITFDGLAELLGINAVNAEKIATGLISSDRLKGSIDQLECVVYFEVTDPLDEWDKRIVSICELVNLIGEKISTKYPECLVR